MARANTNTIGDIQILMHTLYYNVYFGSKKSVNSTYEFFRMRKLKFQVGNDVTMAFFSHLKPTVHFQWKNISITKH